MAALLLPLAAVAQDQTVNGNLNVSGKVQAADLTFGANGLSVKSALASRAPLPGLVFDGTAGASAPGLPAFGRGDFTVVLWIKLDVVNTTQLFLSGSTGNFLEIGNVATGNLIINKGTGTLVGQWNGVLTAGKTQIVAYTRAAGIGAATVNGTSLSTITDASDYSAAPTTIGSRGDNTYTTTGVVRALMFNRALSAGEVLVLTENCGPASIEVNSASNTNLFTGAWVTYNGAGSVSSSGPDNFALTASNNYNAKNSPGFAIKAGQRVALLGDFSGITGTVTAYLYGDGGSRSESATITATGCEIVATSASSDCYVFVSTTGAGTITGANVKVVRTGLVGAWDYSHLALDSTSAPAMPGVLCGPLTWTTGVKPSVPWSGTLPGNVTVGGNLAVNGTFSAANFSSTGTTSLGGSLSVLAHNSVPTLAIGSDNFNAAFGASFTDGSRTFLGYAWNATDGNNTFLQSPDGMSYIKATQLDGISFGTNPWGSSAPLEKMRIDKNGNVGIGTKNPSSKLYILASAQTADVTASALQVEQRYVDRAGDLLGSAVVLKTNNDSGTVWNLGAVAGTVGKPGDYQGYPGGLSFYTKPNTGGASSALVERVRVDYDGNVGIGTTTPSAKLEVAGDAKITGSLTVNGTFTAPNYTATNGTLTGSEASGLTLNAGGSNQDVTIAPTGTGKTVISKLEVNGGLKVGGVGGVDQQFGTFTANGGVRELFRVSSANLATGGTFAVSATRGNFVHTSQWAWSSSHNATGRGVLTQLSGGDYTNMPFYLDVASDGSVIVSTNWGADQTYSLAVQKTMGGPVDTSAANSEWTIVAAGYTRASVLISTNNFQAQNGALASGARYLSPDGAPWWLNGAANGPAILLQQHGAAGGPTNRRGSLGWMDNNGVKYETLTWTDAGYVGIGTSAPAAKLHVGVSSTQPAILFSGRRYFDGVAEGDDGVAILHYYSGPGNRQIMFADSAQLSSSVAPGLRLGLGGSVAWIDAATPNGAQGRNLELNGTMTVQNHGYVGIGTISPDANLTVAGDLHIQQNGGSSFYIQTPSSDTRMFTIGHPLRLGAGSNIDQLVLQPSGDVGIGTNSPTSQLELKGVAPFLTINGTDNTKFKGIQFATNASIHASLMSNIQTGELRMQSGAAGFGGYLTFNTDGIERLRIQANTGNVGIGTENPGQRLDVAGHIRAFGTGANTQLRAEEGGVFTKLQSQTMGAVQGIVGTESNTNFSFVTNNIVRGTFDIAGNLGIGTTAPAAKLDVAGNAKITGTLDATSNGTFGGSLNLTNGQGNNWAIKNDGGNFALSTTSTSGGATPLKFDRATQAATFGGAVKLGDNAWSLSQSGSAFYLSGTAGTALTIDSARKARFEGAIESAGTATFSGKVTASSDLIVNAPGRVGIGTANPTRALEVNGGPLFKVTDPIQQTTIGYTSGAGAFGSLRFKMSWYDDGGGWGAEIRNQDVDGGGNLIFMTTARGTSPAATPAERMRIDPSGNVGIGTTATTDAMLSVNGLIRAREVVVDPSSVQWADYVFADGYRNAPLSDVEAHIKEYKHLPGVPSAKEVADKGVNVGQMQAVLLQKIEELTLHMIEQEKFMKQQAEQNAELRREVEMLKQSAHQRDNI